MRIGKESFGRAEDGQEVFLYTLENGRGMRASVTNYGAVLVSLLVPDKDGKFSDVVLGFDRAEDYHDNSCFFGATVGRNANRIAGARVTISGVTYELDRNEGENNLHTHFEKGMHKKVWQAETDEENNAVRFQCKSADGETGFPGNLDMTVTYQLTEDDAIEIKYRGVSDMDTVINMTNHSYFNLGGHDSGSIMDEKLKLRASAYTPIVPGAIPTGEILPVEGTPMDFRSLKRIGDEIDTPWEQLTMVGGYDHNWVVDKKDDGIEKIAMVVDEEAGRVMEVYSDLPGVQFYAGNGISETAGKGGARYGARSGLCLETQYYPNAANQPGFPPPIVKAGQIYETTTIYKFV